jgi:flagellin-like protein
MVGNKLKEMLQDDKGVSPVIGVILMVAVTVVLAAVIGSFVFGLGDGLNQPAPSTQIEFDYDASNEKLTVIHDGGETLTASNAGEIIVDGTAETSFPYSAGDEIATGIDAAGGDEVDVVWVSVDGSQTQVLATFEAP